TVDPGGLNRTTTYTYDALNDQTSATDPLGKTSTMSYDARGNLLSIISPFDDLYVTEQDLAYGDSSHPGDVTQMSDIAGVTASLAYDLAGNLTSVTDALANKTTYTY